MPDRPNDSEDDRSKPAAPPPGGLPEVDFSTFLLSLSTSVLFHLGLAQDDDGSVPATDLPLAKQTIDILALLEVKTRGNLSTDEANLLQNLLYDLRLRYVSISRGR